MDPLALLGRKDKWFLGGGSGAIAAAPFPRFILAPGFCDECYFGDIRLPQLFTVHFLDPQDRPIRFESYVKGWRPDRLTVMHYAGDIVIRERRCVTSANAWVSEFELVTAVDPITVVLYVTLPHQSEISGTPWHSLDSITVGERAIESRWRTAWPDEVSTDRTGIDAEHLAGGSEMRPPTDVFLCFGASGERHSLVTEVAQNHDMVPRWETTVLPETLHRGRLPNTEAQITDGIVHLAQQFVLSDRTPLVCACGGGLTVEAARESLRDAVMGDPIQQSATDWRAYFGSVPQFESSDPFLTTAYWYRWYGLRLNTVRLDAPFVTEGVGFFRNFITYSAQAHLREVSWMHDPSLALGIVENLRRTQRPNGFIPGHTYSNRPARDFYHADFATGIRQIEVLHDVLVPRDWMVRYAEYLESRMVAGWVQVHDQNETGQEYMSRYTEVIADADEWKSFSIGGVDATTYYTLLCEFLARENGGRIALAGGWDSQEQFYCDHFADGRLSYARPATGFYPYLLSGFGDGAALDRWLVNPNEFWLERGFPATAKSDPTFDASAHWKGRRLNCPWNGRSWPMANSHLVDALAMAARNQRPDLRQKAGESLMKVIRMMFHDGNPSRPNSYEHYNPETGTPALYRGFDDYMHSWIIDLIMRHAVGVLPGETAIDPLPLDVEWIRCDQIPAGTDFRSVEILRGKPYTELESRPPLA